MGRRKGSVKIPVHGKAAHNTGFLTAIGGLVINWANNESVFLAMLQLLVRGGTLSAAIVWHSHRTSIARLELVHRLCREQVKDTELLEEITRAMSQFKGFSRTRNFFCHATYRYDSNLCLANVSGAVTPPEGEAISYETKNMDRATLNEINSTSIQLAEFNGRLWKLVIRLQNELGVQHEDLPKLLPASK
jgi:hypothetical protein